MFDNLLEMFIEVSSLLRAFSILNLRPSHVEYQMSIYWCLRMLGFALHPHIIRIVTTIAGIDFATRSVTRVLTTYCQMISISTSISLYRSIMIYTDIYRHTSIYIYIFLFIFDILHFWIIKSIVDSLFLVDENGLSLGFSNHWGYSSVEEYYHQASCSRLGVLRPKNVEKMWNMYGNVGPEVASFMGRWWNFIWMWNHVKSS